MEKETETSRNRDDTTTALPHRARGGGGGWAEKKWSSRKGESVTGVMVKISQSPLTITPFSFGRGSLDASPRAGRWSLSLCWITTSIAGSIPNPIQARTSLIWKVDPHLLFFSLSYLTAPPHFSSSIFFSRYTSSLFCAFTLDALCFHLPISSLSYLKLSLIKVSEKERCCFSHQRLSPTHSHTSLFQARHHRTQAFTVFADWTAQH